MFTDLYEKICSGEYQGGHEAGDGHIQGGIAGTGWSGGMGFMHSRRSFSFWFRELISAP